MIRMNSIVLLLALIAGRSFAGTSADVVRPAAKLSADKVHAGGSVKAAVILQIADGWHVNAHTPSADYLIGTTVSVKSQ
jgi:thiol:disulfide interchange protein DsbD